MAIQAVSFACNLPFSFVGQDGKDDSDDGDAKMAFRITTRTEETPMTGQEATQRRNPIARLMQFLRSWSFLLLVSALAGSLPVSAQDDADLVIIDADGTPLKAYTVDELADLPQHKIVTGNEFVEGKVTFEGPLVRDVLKDAGLEPGEKLTFVALNDYAVEIPASELEKYDAILALKADGKWLSRRDKGPIWVIYPMDDHPELQDPVYNSRLVWQLARIENR